MSEGDESLIQIEDLHFSRGGRVIFSGFNATFCRQRNSAVMGLSGSGKTTLLKLIGGQLKPNAGRILFDGIDIHRLAVDDLYRQRRKLGVLFQSGALLTDCTVFENVAFPLREHTSLSEPLIRQMVRIKLNAVGLAGAEHLLPAALSGGMSRRVALARAIILDPLAVMYDEPFTGLDPITKGVILRLIGDLSRLLHLTSILVSHDVQETCAIADQIFLINEGRLVSSGSPSELLNDSNPWTQQFMHGQDSGPVSFDYSPTELRPSSSRRGGG